MRDDIDEDINHLIDFRKCHSIFTEKTFRCYVFHTFLIFLFKQLESLEDEL